MERWLALDVSALTEAEGRAALADVRTALGPLQTVEGRIAAHVGRLQKARETKEAKSTRIAQRARDMAAILELKGFSKEAWRPVYLTFKDRSRTTPNIPEGVVPVKADVTLYGNSLKHGHEDYSIEDVEFVGGFWTAIEAAAKSVGVTKPDEPLCTRESYDPSLCYEFNLWDSVVNKQSYLKEVMKHRYLDIDVSKVNGSRKWQSTDMVQVIFWAGTDLALERRRQQDTMSTARVSWMAAVVRATPCALAYPEWWRSQKRSKGML